jgi:two-component system invasion response regulator UvrY
MGDGGQRQHDTHFAIGRADVKPVTVMLVDDHPVVRDGIRHFLESAPDIRVVGEAGSGEEGVALFREHAPDVIILDLGMEGIGGLEAIRRVTAHNLKSRVLVFSMHDSETIVLRALEAGAAGYVTKQSGMGQLLEAVRRVAKGEMFVDAGYVAALAMNRNAAPTDPLQALSRREFQMFRLFAEGRSVAGIAETLSISPKTVGVHHTNIMNKLNLKNAAQLVRLAIRCNVIEP